MGKRGWGFREAALLGGRTEIPRVLDRRMTIWRGFVELESTGSKMDWPQLLYILQPSGLSMPASCHIISLIPWIGCHHLP